MVIFELMYKNVCQREYVNCILHQNPLFILEKMWNAKCEYVTCWLSHPYN